MARAGAGRHIRFITRKWAPAMGGMETYSVRLSEELAKAHQVEIIALPGRRSGQAPTPLQLLAFGFRSAVRLLFSKPAEVVHVGDVASWPLGWIASLRHPRSHIALSAHGSDLSFAMRKGVRAKLYGLYLRLGAKALRHAVLIANSQWIGSLAADTGFRTIVIVPLATDIRRPADVKGHNGALFFAGRIAKRKGLSFLVRSALPHMAEPPPVRVAGTIWEADEAKVLEDPRVTFLGALGSDALAREYAEALCVVVPSLEPEGFGLVAAEAAAAGGVVIAAAHSGLVDAVDPNTGFLLDTGDPAEWARIIGEIRAWSAEERARFIDRSAKTAGAKFSWSRVAEDTARAYELAEGR